MTTLRSGEPVMVEQMEDAPEDAPEEAHEDAPEDAPQEGTSVDPTKTAAISKIRGRLKVRSMANTWRRRANNKALPSLTPFIPYLLREEMLEMAKWCVLAAATTRID
jgi:hypothetical protein